MSERRLRGALHDVGGVLASFVVLLVLENLAIGFGYRAEFTAGWEMSLAGSALGPLALAASIPLACAAVGLGHLLARRDARPLAALAAAAGALVGLGVTNGRHFASLALRVPFVVVLALVAAGVARVVAPRLPLDRPRLLAGGGGALALLAWLADARVLPRLYPAFHLALFAVTALAWSATWLVVRPTPAAKAVSRGALALSLLSLAWSPRAARMVAGSDNLRRVLLEHAPVLGRAVRLAAVLAPPPPLDDEASDGTVTAAAKVSADRTLDWTGRDIVLVTIDALRADHVSSYGYARTTTPSIDALAARGVRFTHAYCPTPHTSYSVASMMTGKYVRPLLAMGAKDDAETWPLLLRRYGYRTAAFYPPAVFFIDAHKFPTMQREGLGFEYRKEEFADEERRRAQIERYLAQAPRDKPLFLWVHLFEPHEPYEEHPAHVFRGDETSDAYDSEIAAADALVGDVVRLVEARRPGAVTIVSADHGEELGDHGGRYHGTTVYEEQVRVPLVVVAPGLAPRVVTAPVQTIDLLPTTLAALDVPRPARLRGRDLGPLLVGKAAPDDEGLAFAETDEQTLVARGSDRLVCARKIGACTLFDVAKDPGQRSPVTDRPARVAELRRLTAAIERENGKVEFAGLPEALRRGLQGDRDAAEDVLPLFDDSRVDIRRAAARCAFRLRAPEMTPQLRRALAKDEDAEVREWSALALVRLGEPLDELGPLAATALEGGDAARRTAAALALAERGDARGEPSLVARWDEAFTPGATAPGEIDEAREILAALATVKARSAVPSLVRSIGDVRLRPFVVGALGALGDPRAREPILAAFVAERYVHMRAPEARALVALGEKGAVFRAALARFLGTPDPTVELLAIAHEAGLVPAGTTGEGPSRLLVLVQRGTPPDAVAATLEPGERLALTASAEDVLVAEIPALVAGARVAVTGEAVRARWVVRRAPEVPPPPPQAWDGGASSADDIP